MSDILIKLRQVGYDVSVEGSEVHLRWRRDEPPRRERVLPLLREAKHRKREILAALARLAGTSHGDEPPARRLTPRAYEPADGGEWTSSASRLRAPEHSIANATHPDCQGTTLDNPAPSPDEEAAESSASIDAIDTQASGAREAIPPVDLTRCGWCGSTQLRRADTGSGRIYCRECRSVYNPSQACWSPGDSAKRRRD